MVPPKPPLNVSTSFAGFSCVNCTLGCAMPLSLAVWKLLATSDTTSEP
jgi:hypothetical protein